MLIPQANIPHLMLNEKVRTAIAKGKFHIYPVSTIDEGIAVLTGIPAGKLSKKGVYPAGTINRKVIDRLTTLNEKAREASKKSKGEGDGKDASRVAEAE